MPVLALLACRLLSLDSLAEDLDRSACELLASAFFGLAVLSDGSLVFRPELLWLFAAVLSETFGFLALLGLAAGSCSQVAVLLLSAARGRRLVAFESERQSFRIPLRAHLRSRVLPLLVRHGVAFYLGVLALGLYSMALLRH